MYGLVVIRMYDVRVRSAVQAALDEVTSGMPVRFDVEIGYIPAGASAIAATVEHDDGRRIPITTMYQLWSVANDNYVLLYIDAHTGNVDFVALWDDEQTAIDAIVYDMQGRLDRILRLFGE